MARSNKEMHEYATFLARAIQLLQETDNAAHVCPPAYRPASVATPDGGTRAARPFSSRRTARAARPVAVRSRVAVYAKNVRRTGGS